MTTIRISGGSSATPDRRTVEYGLAAVLAVAALLKAVDISSPQTRNSGFSVQYLATCALIAVELALAGWVLMGGRSRLRWAVMILWFSALGLVATYNVLQAKASCGCFGKMIVPPIAIAAFDHVAVVALWLAAPAGMIRRPARRYIMGIGGCLWIASASASSYAYVYRQHLMRPASSLIAAPAQDAANELIVLDALTWVGRPFPLFEYIPSSEPIKVGHWLVLFYHYDCDECLHAIPAYRSLARTHNSNLHVAFVALPPFAPAGQEPISDDNDSLRCTLMPVHNWFATAPIGVELENGVVKKAAQGETAVRPDPLSW